MSLAWHVVEMPPKGSIDAASISSKKYSTGCELGAKA